MEVKLSDDTTVPINKLPLGKYSDVLKALTELPKQFDKFKSITSLSNNDFIAILPSLIGECMPDLIRIVKIATDLPEEKIQNLGIDEFTEIVIAIYTVNNYQAVYEKLKKLFSRKANPEQTQPAAT